MSVDPSIVGATSEPETFEVERGAIRKFAEAIGDPNPVYRTGDVAPPTFPTTFRVRIPSFAVDPARLLHGGEEYVYERPIRAGDRLTCVRRVVETFVKQGRLGQMTFVVTELEGRDAEGSLVVRGHSTILIR